MALTEAQKEAVERILEANRAGEVAEDEAVLDEIQKRVNKQIKEQYGMEPDEYYDLSEDEEKALTSSEQRIIKSVEDVEQAPLSPSEVSNEARVRYNKLIENGADPVKALAWLEAHTGNYDDFALKAVSERLLPDDVLRANAEGVEAKRLLKDYFDELVAQGLSVSNIQDYFDMKMTRHTAREAIARDRGIQRQLQKEKDAETKATLLNNRATAAKWANESRQLGIPPDASRIAAKLGCAEKDIKDLCE